MNAPNNNPPGDEDRNPKHRSRTLCEIYADEIRKWTIVLIPVMALFFDFNAVFIKRTAAKIDFVGFQWEAWWLMSVTIIVFVTGLQVIAFIIDWVDAQPRGWSRFFSSFRSRSHSHVASVAKMNDLHADDEQSSKKVA